MKIKFIATLAFVATVFIACVPSQSTPSKTSKIGIDDTQIGLRNVTLEDEKDLNLPEIDWSKASAGESQRYERSYENAPPLIPHDIEGLVPITKESNACIDCHMPEFAKDVGATPIPKSHLTDLRTGKDLGGKLSEARFNCTQCHVPQANAKPLVENNFQPDFRKDSSKSKSNLMQVINEGVK